MGGNGCMFFKHPRPQYDVFLQLLYFSSKVLGIEENRVRNELDWIGFYSDFMRNKLLFVWENEY